METQHQSESFISDDIKSKLKQTNPDSAMISSTTSSLASPVDSGVQLLDSESSEIASVMSISGYEGIPKDKSFDNGKIKNDINKEKLLNNNNINQNQNLSTSAPTQDYFEKFNQLNKLNKTFPKSCSEVEMEHPIESTKSEDLLNISLTSYELLDYTQQNRQVLSPENPDQMHVSMSEEVNENLKVSLITNENDILPIIEDVPKEIIKPPEEQIVFRRQRKKKSKSDTPKKRVSFHEDILNSTKIDDVHINHGFITMEPQVSLSFFQRGFTKKPDVVVGRYSWAAEGDSPYYKNNKQGHREIQSDIYNPRYSSTSSSSTGSFSSSIDEEDSEENCEKKEKQTTLKKPKSSCLKKTERKKIDTKIVEETIKKRSDNNLLDSNIFGSLKNILNFSTSVPLAERGVPEGQEDFTIYSTSDYSTRRKSCTNFTFNEFEKSVEPASALVPSSFNNKLDEAKTNLKLTKSEGFYPNYPSNTNIPNNVVLCDSNVYEHKGISYSYEYDEFQKSFKNEQKQKSSSIYQMILKEFNFFRKKAKQLSLDESKSNEMENFEIIQNNEQVEEVDINKNINNIQTAKMDWSDNETISDFLDNSRHLNSPKRKVNRSNHYTISQFKLKNESDPHKMLLKSNINSNKNSLINRFLRNVTLKKLLDGKANKKILNDRKYLSLFIEGVKYKYEGPDELDRAIELEIEKGLMVNSMMVQDTYDRKMLVQFKKEIFRNRSEILIRVFPVRSAYTPNGESKPLLAIISNITLYIVGYKPNGTYCNHFVLPFTELNTILIGPNGQTIHLSNYDKDMQCIITTGCATITNEFVGQLEMAMRKDPSKPKLAAVKQLNMRDMTNLRRDICKQTSVDKEEEYFYYSIVNIQDFTSDFHEATPLGLNKEGPLMFKTTDVGSRWETAYFILKAGVLYMLSSASQRVPMRVLPLINGSCQQARRVFNCPRPHTFQVIIEGRSIYLAAPNEYVASEWLQCFIHAASGSYNNNNKEKSPTISCSLLMTNEHILTVREAFPSQLPIMKNQHQSIKSAQTLSCAAIVDLVAFRLPSAEQSWCILEFSCREVHECSGDWILYFSTNAELENFISTLEMLWEYNNDNGDSFPLSTIPETDPLSKKCVDIYTQLRNLWPSNSVHLQFL